ncbi:MAG: peptidase S10 [Bacteroidetes bacterium]|nr:MAG: peptidase S10 [Bacteroidota bacterium]
MKKQNDRRPIWCLCFLFLLTFFSLSAQQKTTQHSLRLASGETIEFTATTGFMNLVLDSTRKARVFFVAYTKNGVREPKNRPLTFAFNGGPGSSSVWLHMGALGPRRILMDAEGGALPPPYETADNPQSWLGWTDLVFIDPVMTGFSRPMSGIDKKKFTGYVEDIESVGEFIRLYTSQNGRWNSPKFLAGESYGTTRAAGLSGYLQDRYGFYLNGIVLISHITNFQTARFEIGNDLPYPLFLPTYAATAWYHKKLDPAYTDLHDLLDEVEKFALGEYTLALMKGDRLSAAEKASVTKKLAQYTGLSESYIEQCNRRPVIHRFVKELRRDEGLTVGRLDSRFTGSDYDDTRERYEFDPSYNGAIYGPFSMAINDHLRRYLQFEHDDIYEILTGRVRPWNYDNVQNTYLNVSETLRNAMHKNPYLKVLVCNGYYDLATPYFATEYTFDHMFLDEKLHDNITFKYYEAGHMMYIHQKSFLKFTEDVRDFYESAWEADTHR